jgi:hypothetical protein
MRRWVSGAFFVIVVGLAALGQFYFVRQRNFMWDGLVFYLLASIIFVRLWRNLARPFHSGDAPIRREGQGGLWGWLRAHPLELGLTALACALVVIASLGAQGDPQRTNFNTLLLLWLVGLVLLIVAWVPSFRQVRWPRRSTLVMVALLFLVALALRAWDLEHIPANLGGDEGTQGLSAYDVLEGRLRNPFATGWYGVPTMAFFVQALSLRLFGYGTAGLRAISALFGALTIPFTFLLFRRLFSGRVAVAGTVALTVNHFQLHYSRLGSVQIADTLFAVIVFWALIEGLRSGKMIYFVLSGMALGAAWYGYFGGRVLIVIIGLYLGWSVLFERGFWARHRGGLVLMGLAAFLVAAPLLTYYSRHPQELSARYNQVGIFPSGWLEREVKIVNKSAIELLWQQTWKSVLAFNYTVDPTFWYRASIPLIDAVSSVFFALGLVWTTLRLRHRGYRLLALWFWCSVLIGWVLTENPPSSMRMVVVAPAVCGIIAVGLDRVVMLGRKLLGGARGVWRQAFAAVILVTVVLNLVYYFNIYTPTLVYGNPTAEVGTVLGNALREREGEPVYYFYGPPAMLSSHGTLAFIARNARGVDVPALNDKAPFPRNAPPPDLIVILGERKGELASIQSQYPGGTLRPYYSRGDKRLMFWVYEGFAR